MQHALGHKSPEFATRVALPFSSYSVVVHQWAQGTCHFGWLIQLHR